MKKLYALLGFLLLNMSVSLGANTIPPNNMATKNVSTPQTTCDGGSWSETYYVGKTPMRYLYDYLIGDTNKNYIIGFDADYTYANIYNPYTALSFQNGGALAFNSQIKPRGVDKVIVAQQNQGDGTNIIGHAPKRTDLAAQISYTVARKVENGTTATAKYRYLKIDDTALSSIDTNSAFNSKVTQDNECMNMYVGRCGDGILDNGTSLVVNGQSTTAGQLAGGEQCDDGALNGTPGHCTISCTGTGTTGKLTITKTLVTNKTYYSGDFVEWRIDFANKENTVATNVVVGDELPRSLTYIDSTIFGVTAQKRTYYGMEGEFVVEYTGFSLKPGDSGYIILKTQVNGKLDYSQYRYNCAGIWAPNFKEENSCALYTYGTGNNPVAPTCLNITPGASSTNSSERNFVCAGKNTISGVTPMSIDCGNGVIKNGFASPAGFFSPTCTYSSPSQAQSAKASCAVANDTANPACITSNNYACTLDGDSMVAIVGDENNNGEVEYTCNTKDGKEHLLQIDCGTRNSQKSRPETDNSLSYTCQYDQSDYDYAKNSNKTLTAKCYIDGATAPSCTKDTIIDQGLLGICGNNIREGYEQCDEGGYRGKGDTCDVGCVKPCTDKCDENIVQCLSVANSNVSIQSKEILPFWWRIYNAENLVDNTVACNQTNLDGNNGVLVRRAGMKCSFSIRQPTASKPINIDTLNCATDLISMKQPLFTNFYPQYWDYAFGTFYRNFSDIFKNNTIFGEYKIRLHQVDYQYCNKDTLKYERTQMNNVCETDFVVTKPYMIQKSAFGATPKATNTNLKNFYDMKGNSLIDRTDLADVMLLDENTYDGGNDAKFLIITEAAKIAKLAVTMSPDKVSQSLLDAKVTVKKVPNKLIYILEGKGNTEVTMQPAATFTTPFTIITKGINLTIEGSMNTNGMFVVQGGTIKFKEDTNPDVRCKAPQVVKGIFVTDKGFTATPIENTSLYTPWCMYGNLQVQGILIGSDLDSIVTNRRSNLNKWFRVSGSAKSQEVQRRNQIFNGASLLIEYNTDLWRQLPPGADQFVNLLDIYKK